MTQSDWQDRRQEWSDGETAEVYDLQRFSSAGGRRKHDNDVSRLLSALRSHLPQATGEGPPTILDLPCGTGRLHADLQAAGYKVHGADLSTEMLNVASTATDSASLLLSEAEHLPLVDDCADAVLSLRFLIHIRDATARHRILSEMSRVARHLVIAQVRDPRSLKHRMRQLRSALRLPAKLREPTLDRAALNRELEAAGLKLLAICPISRLFSDKALFIARPLRRGGDQHAD
jgi:ubiquinone/menaquinone biosynthesis C-methylase UbiE